MMLSRQVGRTSHLRKVPQTFNEEPIRLSVATVQLLRRLRPTVAKALSTPLASIIFTWKLRPLWRCRWRAMVCASTAQPRFLRVSKRRRRRDWRVTEQGHNRNEALRWRLRWQAGQFARRCGCKFCCARAPSRVQNTARDPRQHEYIGETLPFKLSYKVLRQRW